MFFIFLKEFLEILMEYLEAVLKESNLSRSRCRILFFHASLPLDFPHWKTVYTYFAKWKMSGLWEQINDTLRTTVRQARECRHEIMI